MENDKYINAYFDNMLTESEKIEFENKLKNNIELKNQYDFKKQIIDGIRYARKKELIQRLDKINIGNHIGKNILTNTLMIFGSIIITTSAYFYFNKDKELVKRIKTDEIIHSSKEFVKTNNTKEVSDIPNTEETEQKTETKLVTKTEKSKGINPPTINKPKIIDPLEMINSEEENYTHENFNTNISENKNSGINIVIDNGNKKHSFHYKVKDNQLILYGEFDKGLYEVIEINDEKNNNVYLYYDDKFYSIKFDDSNIRKLTEVSDKNTIKKLSKIKK